jgi:hypothetical protein
MERFDLVSIRKNSPSPPGRGQVRRLEGLADAEGRDPSRITGLSARCCGETDRIAQRGQSTIASLRHEISKRNRPEHFECKCQ